MRVYFSWPSPQRCHFFLFLWFAISTPLAFNQAISDTDSERISSSASNHAFKSPQWNLGSHLRESFIGKNSLYHLGAVGLTWLSVESEFDGGVQAWAEGQDETVSTWTSAPGLLGGMLLPLAIPGAMFIISDNPETRSGGAAAIQAVFTAFAANNLLKAVTGRPPPDADTPVDVYERSKKFRFGFLRGGVFHGWPSGHAMTNMAFSASLASYYRDSWKIRTLSFGWAAYVAYSATLGMQGGVHWFSDGISGLIMGWVIGNTIGRGFRGKEKPADGISIHLLPGFGSVSGIKVRFLIN